MTKKEHPLKRYMDARGLNQAELARELGLSETMVSYVFRGKKSFGKRRAARIASQTKIPVLDLLYGESHG